MFQRKKTPTRIPSALSVWAAGQSSRTWAGMWGWGGCPLEEEELCECSSGSVRMAVVPECGHVTGKAPGSQPGWEGVWNRDLLDVPKPAGRDGPRVWEVVN